MYCRNCGQTLPDGMKYCTKCGSVLSESAPDAKPEEMTAGMAADTAGISDMEAEGMQPETPVSEEENVTNQLLREILRKMDENKRDLRSNQKYGISDEQTLNREIGKGSSNTGVMLCCLAIIYLAVTAYTSAATYAGEVIDLLQYLIPNLMICAILWGLGAAVDHLHRIRFDQQAFYESHRTPTGFEELED